MSEPRRMFESDLVERFSRIPPWQPPAIYLPVMAVLAVVGLRQDGVGLAELAGLAVTGALIWTFLEYWLHRVLFHYRPRSAFGRRLFWIMHGVHHDWPDDAFRLVFPPMVSVPIALLCWWLFTVAAGETRRWALMLGLVAGYLAYDMLHYWMHHGSPTGRLGRGLRRHHLAHHFRDDGRGFGVSSPLWDWVFGTLR